MNEWDYEVDARIFGGGKKKNFNQLLSFTSNYQPSRQESGRNWRQSATTYRRPKQPSHSAIQDYNKERFLQANCQFIVVDSGNYTLNIADPDVLVEWDLVEELVSFMDCIKLHEVSYIFVILAFDWRICADMSDLS